MRPSRHSLFDSRTLPVFILTLTLAVGLAGCDSSGSNSGNDDADRNDEPEIAKTFTVTVKKTDSSYPYDDQNNIGVAYAIDGTIGKVITLERGKTYEFVLESSVASGPNGTSHPFYVAETAQGGGGDAFLNDPAMETSGTVTFSPPSGAPDSLFYECGAHQYMGGKMEITGTTSGSGDDDGGNDGPDDGDY